MPLPSARATQRMPRPRTRVAAIATLLPWDDLLRIWHRALFFRCRHTVVGAQIQCRLSPFVLLVVPAREHDSRARVGPDPPGRASPSPPSQCAPRILSSVHRADRVDGVDDVDGFRQTHGPKQRRAARRAVARAGGKRGRRRLSPPRGGGPEDVQGATRPPSRREGGWCDRDLSAPAREPHHGVIHAAARRLHHTVAPCTRGLGGGGRDGVCGVTWQQGGPRGVLTTLSPFVGAAGYDPHVPVHIWTITESTYAIVHRTASAGVESVFLVIGRLRANAPTACIPRTRTTPWHRYFEMLPQSSHQACANREAPLSRLPNLKNNMAVPGAPISTSWPMVLGAPARAIELLTERRHGKRDEGQHAAGPLISQSCCPRRRISHRSSARSTGETSSGWCAHARTSGPRTAWCGGANVSS